MTAGKDRIAAAAKAERDAKSEIVVAVAEARRDGMTWAQIAEQTGTPMQATWSRFWFVDRASNGSSGSVMAARTLDAANDRAIVLDALHAIGGRGSADDVWEYLDRTQPSRRWQRSCISSRLSQLKDPGRYAGDPPVVVLGTVPGRRVPVLLFGVVA